MGSQRRNRFSEVLTVGKSAGCYERVLRLLVRVSKGGPQCLGTKLILLVVVVVSDNIW